MCYFSGFGWHATCVERTELQSILEKFEYNYLSNESHFSDWLGKGFEIPAYEENRIFEVKSLVGFYRDRLLYFGIRLRHMKTENRGVSFLGYCGAVPVGSITT